MDTEKKQIHLNIQEDIYRKLKVKCAYKGVSMQKYIADLIGASIEENTGKGGLLLIVEDEAILRESLKDSLKDEHSVTTAETGEEALEIIKKKDFDIIIVDVRLPGITGLDVVRWVKQSKPYVRAIVITAYPSVELAVEAMKQGAVDYLVKPINLEVLGALIWDNLQKVGKKRPVLE